MPGKAAKKLILSKGKWLIIGLFTFCKRGINENKCSFYKFFDLLIVRLEFYVKNDNFGRDEDLLDKNSYMIVTPSRSVYRDINADTVVSY